MAFPSSPSVGDIYSEDGFVYFYNGDRWSAGWGTSYQGGDIVCHHIAPTPSEGLIWLNIATNDVKKYASGDWLTIGNIGL